MRGCSRANGDRRRGEWHRPAQAYGVAARISAESRDRPCGTLAALSALMRRLTPMHLALPVALVTLGCGGRAEEAAADRAVDAGTSSDSGAPSVGWSDPTSAPDCQASPTSYAPYTTVEELDALLVGRWRRCSAPQVNGEDVGVEFAADGRWYPLTWGAAHEVVRRVGVDYGGTWEYAPPGTVSPISHEPSPTGWIDLSGVLTSPPAFTNDPRQLRVNLTPVQSRYVPLAP